MLQILESQSSKIFNHCFSSESDKAPLFVLIECSKSSKAHKLFSKWKTNLVQYMISMITISSIVFKGIFFMTGIHYIFQEFLFKIHYDTSLFQLSHKMALLYTKLEIQFLRPHLNGSVSCINTSRSIFPLENPVSRTVWCLTLWISLTIPLASPYGSNAFMDTLMLSYMLLFYVLQIFLHCSSMLYYSVCIFLYPSFECQLLEGIKLVLFISIFPNLTLVTWSVKLLNEWMMKI